MSNNHKYNRHQIHHPAARVAIALFSLIALYLAGFVVAITVGPGLSHPVTNVLSVVYWPLIKADENKVEPFHRIIEWLRHGPKPQPASGKQTTTPAAPRPAR